MKNIAILASGNGTNAEAIIRHFSDNPEISISLIVSNREKAFVLERARNHGIEGRVLSRDEFYDDHTLTGLLNSFQVDFIVLAGFLWLIPKSLIRAYPDRIVNIHPALLPKYGGKGMYGMKVHEAVKAAAETETGITIHMVNENYDEGRVIFQARCRVGKDDSPEDIAARVHELEYQYYPGIIEAIVKNQ